MGTLVLAGLAVLAASQLSRARTQLLLARTDLAVARHALSARDDAAAGKRLDVAEKRVRTAERAATAFPFGTLRVLPLLGSPARALKSAARAGMEGVAAGRVMVATSASFPTSASAAVDGKDLSAFHAAAERSVAAITEADAHLLLASTALAGPAGATLGAVSRPAKTMKAELDRSRSELDGAARGLALLGDLTAPATDATILVLSQDSLELRPTGGFVGSYGVLRFSRGTARLEKYEATEDLPLPNPPVKAPEGLASYLPAPWSLSNSNWWPDFPTSAAAAAELYRRQGGGQVDGVLALTELTTARLVGALGPFQLPSYAKPVVEAGFEERILEEVELKRPLDVPRKKFLIELSDALFDRLFHLPAAKVPAVADVFKQSVSAGDIQLWFKDPQRQRELAGSVIAGALPRPDGDFLMVVDANLTASKANLNVSKTVDYRVDRDGNGRLVGHVRIEIRNEGAEGPANRAYASYLRVYAPEGAQLIQLGFLQGHQAATDGPFEVFSQRVVVMPRKEGLVMFDYLLPERLDNGAYTLTWLRQAGTSGDELRAAADKETARADPRVRVLAFAPRQHARGGLVGWLQDRWVVRKLGLG